MKRDNVVHVFGTYVHQKKTIAVTKITYIYLTYQLGCLYSRLYPL